MSVAAIVVGCVVGWFAIGIAWARLGERHRWLVINADDEDYDDLTRGVVILLWPWVLLAVVALVAGSMLVRVSHWGER